MTRALVGAAIACAIAAGCSSSDSTNAPGDAGDDGTADGAARADGGGEDGGTLGLAVNDVSVYAGQRASLAAQAIGDAGAATFAWTILRAPPGSAVTSASLMGGDGPTPSFVTDVPGDYQLSVDLSAAGVPIESAPVIVHAFAAPVFYVRAQFEANGGEVAVHAAGHDGSDEHAVACAINFQPSESSTYTTRTLIAAASMVDWWEALPGDPSRFAFAGTYSLTKDDAGAYDTFLIAGTTRNSCNTAPMVLRHAQEPAGAFGQPRFSPNGKRIAFVDPLAGGSFGVSTIGFDGSTYRAIGPIYAAPPAMSDESTNIRPEWRDETTVSWTRPLGGNKWSIMTAPDVPGVSPDVYATCDGATTPHRIAWLADGSIVAAYAPTAGAATDLFVVAVDGTGHCTPKNLTSLPGGASSRAHDFSVSPDGKTIAYLHWDATAHGNKAADDNGGNLYAVPVDASKPPAPVGGAPLYGRIGPRWIGGGTRLAWTRAGTVADGGDPREADDVHVLLPDGGAGVDLATGDGVNVIVGAAGPGGSCAMGGSRAPAGASVLALALLALGRRVRRARSRA